MKKHIVRLLLPLCTISSLQAMADDAETLLERNKTLDGMNYKSEQLKLQASMAESYKKMTDSGFIVDERGNPLGVPDLTELGKDVREKGSTATANSGTPFDQALMGNPELDGGLAIGGSPFASQGKGSGGGAGGSAPSSGPDEQQQNKYLALTEVRANSVMVRTNDGLQEVKIGQKVYGMKLQRFDVDSAYFDGPNGTKVVKIDWTTSKR